MQHTTNYNLDMPEGNDPLFVMVNYNGNLQKIDTAIKTVEDKADASSTDIQDLSATVDVLENNVTAVNTRLASAEADITAVDEKADAIEVKADNALTGLLTKQDSITGAASTITSTNLTTSRVLVSDSVGKVNVSNVTSTELGRLSGVTSNVQTQLNNKSNKGWTHLAVLHPTPTFQDYTNNQLASADEILVIVFGTDGTYSTNLFPYHFYNYDEGRTLRMRGENGDVVVTLTSNSSFRYASEASGNSFAIYIK